MSAYPEHTSSAADEMAARVLHTYRAIWSGAERADPVETIGQRIAQERRDALRRGDR